MSSLRTTGNLRTLQVALTHPYRLPHRLRNVVLAKTIYHPLLVEQARLARRLWR